MPNLNLPLSGNVTQAINPWTWFKTVSSQFAFINVNMGKTPNPELEEEILNEVGTYGRQLGRIGEALGVLLDRVKLEGLSPDEERAIRALRYQLDEIARIKARHGSR